MMSAAAIVDYLNTQGLKLPVDEVQVAGLAAEAVMNMGMAEIDDDVLWYRTPEGVALADVVTRSAGNQALLRQAYLALDALLSRCPSQSAAVYVLLPLQARVYAGHLLRLVGQGQPLEAVLPVDEAAALQHIASRSAQTGWLNQVDDVAHWLALGEIQGSRHRGCHSQMAVPVYGDDGRVLGVVYVENAHAGALDAGQQSQWVGLSLSLLPLLQQLHTQWPAPEQPLTETEENQ